MQSMSSKNSSDVALIILAAGEGSRMGEPKQLLLIDGKSLLEWQLEKWSSDREWQTFIVLGAHQKLIREQMKDLDHDWVQNDEWESGMGSSIREGVLAARKKMDNLSGFLIVLLDQVKIELDHLNQILEETRKNPDKIVSAHYNGVLGVPAFFPISYFDDLRKLVSQRGAGALIRENQASLVRIEILEAAFDLDTHKDYEEFIEHRKTHDSDSSEII